MLTGVLTPEAARFAWRPAAGAALRLIGAIWKTTARPGTPSSTDDGNALKRKESERRLTLIRVPHVYLGTVE
jgi:hypothetical protein